jgi:hypothetical protein
MKYKVKLNFIYLDIVHIKADDEKQVIALALSECLEMYERFDNAIIEEEK